MGFNYSAWEVVKGFHNKYPDDPIWSKVKYDGRDDWMCSFTGYYTVMLKIKDYFYQKYFKGITTLVKLKDQPYYDASKQKIPEFKKHETKIIKLHEDWWEEIK